MPLDEYRRKRDFSKTPEPSGDRTPRARKARKPLYFCVQKHLASRLHYDLRLEHNGVLLSWAVPKGPSLAARGESPAAFGWRCIRSTCVVPWSNTAGILPRHASPDRRFATLGATRDFHHGLLDDRDKHMAVQTEDHPYDYGNFEGVIPQGYGAGVVMLWDCGTWQPEVDDVGAALRQGDLKFTLDGYKLKGSWVLVRTRDRPDTAPSQRSRSWLLIKHRDFWSGPIDIATFAPLSVKSESAFDDILAADMPDLWVTGHPARGGSAGKMLRKIIDRAAVKILERRGRQAKDKTGQKPATRTPKAARKAGATSAHQSNRRSGNARSKGDKPGRQP